ncbi:efflux RND transporter permease subunit [Leptonema illini]|uniref:Acriflavin resistance protein n=1 Tax=Leptonema illini DSM 21528 TaxID=929563 RepID=H2CKP9_9LEPT|nr:efflux RND transporter permease subunit [Leptonema illini]EHQ05104.1 acriflavin resistance protein [Leptonema illini DSM 21528]
MSGFSKLLGRPVAASMIVSSLSLLGVVSIFRLPLGLLPNLASPGVTILTRYPGVSSDTIERILTIPIEREMRDIPSIEKILSSSSDGESRVHLVFYPDTDVDIRMLDVREKLFQLEDRFPREVEPPSVLRYDPSNRPVFIVSFSPAQATDEQFKRLREIVEFQIKPAFERIRGVSEVSVGGGSEREIQLQIDPHRLVALQLSEQVPSSLDDGNMFVPAGRLDAGRSLVYADSRLRSIQEIGRLFVPMEPSSREQDSNRPQIPFTAFAQVLDSQRDPTSLSLSNGKERISLYIEKAGDANTLSITDECENELAVISKRFSEIQTHTVYNQGSQIKDAISQVISACIGGVVLAVAVLHFFLRRVGFTLVIGIAIPASLLTTFFLMFLFDIEMNVMSLSGLALGAGMLIDASIVVCEASAKTLVISSNQADEILHAIGRAAASVRGEVIASTLSTIIVFIPLLFADHETRALYRDFTLTVSLSLLTSMIFSLTVLPVFLLRVARYQSIFPMTERQNWASANIGEHRLIAMMRSRISDHINKIRELKILQTERWIAIYCQIATRKKWAVALIGGSILAAPILFVLAEKEYMARTESDTIEASVDLDPGIHLEKTRAIVENIERQIAKHPAIREINSKIESSHATLTIKIDRESGAETTIEELQSITDGNSDGYVHFERSAEGAGGAELELDFYGEDIGAMKQFAKAFADTIQSRIPEVDRVILRFRDGRQDLALYPHTVKNEMHGVSTSAIGRSLRQLIQGNVITKYYDSTPGSEREIDVRVRAKDGLIETPDDILELQLPGTPAPIKALVRPAFEESETRIYRNNRRRSISILLQFHSGTTTSLAVKIEDLIDKSTLPPETVAAFGDSYKKMLANQSQMAASLILSVVLVYLLLAFLFENLVDPLIVLTSIPISLSFVFLLLLILNRPLNISIYIGLIMLGGIVVNNAILILAEIRSEQSALQTIDQFMHASFRRLRPILMTTSTTVLGMAPLLFDTGSQSALWNSLAVAVTSGLLFSMPAVLFIIPFLTYMQKTRSKQEIV